MDRPFGAARTLNKATTGTEGRNAQFLVRVREREHQGHRHQSSARRQCEAPVKEEKKTIKRLPLREIQAARIGRDGKKFALRLWTALIDWAVRRALGEQAVFRELQLDAQPSVLASHPLENRGARDRAVLARLRMGAAERPDVPQRRVGFNPLLIASAPMSWHAPRSQLPSMGAARSSTSITCQHGDSSRTEPLVTPGRSRPAARRPNRRRHL
jgi:hypothetical protein